ncbi:DUF4350 domain-containing protein [Balneola sp. MJW-20]|uniref:DUF4350 domain-containing protein n=1 Tax=Gracilimonas aurantiaca TaxID=3234185 RepID=UPI0034669DAF
MMKKESTYVTILILLIFGYILTEFLKPEEIDWSENYSRTETIPYGSKITYDILEQSNFFPELTINSSPIFKFPEDPRPLNWIFISNSFGLDQWETEILMDRVASGDHVFISAKNFSGALADSLNASTRFNNPLGSGNLLNADDKGSLNFVHPDLKADSGWIFRLNSIETYIQTVDTSRATVIGINDGDQTNFAAISHGEGKIFLHSNPAVFTNYYLRDYALSGYFINAMRLLPVHPTIWDEYYKPGRLSGGVMSFIVSEENLKYAWFTALSAVLLFMIFRAKRRQRIIPEIEAPKNSTIEFARSVGSLYLEKGDHIDIANKRIRFFKDHLRTNLRIDPSLNSEDMIRSIAERAELDTEKVRNLFSVIHSIGEKEEASADELKELNLKIDEFYFLTEKQSQTH